MDSNLHQRRQQKLKVKKNDISHLTRPNLNDFWLPGFIAETILLYLFWCIFTGHIPTVWFGPMSILRATDYGEEFYYLVAYFSPLLLSFEKIRQFLEYHPILSHLLPLIGIPSLLVTSLRDRTLLVCLGTLFGMPVHWSSFWAKGNQREQSIWAALLSLVAFTSSRFAFSTIVPLWWNSFTTLGGLVVGVLAAVVLGYYKVPVVVTEPAVPASFATDYRLGVGFGTLLFLTHWILSSHGVIARWIDLDPFPVGICLIFCMVFGLLISKQPFIRSWTWWWIAILSGPALISPILNKHVAILFGLFIVVYLTSVWHVAVTDLSNHANMIRSLIIASITYLLGNLAIIWSVAYCFVPPGTGGPFMRERVGQVFCLSLFLVGLSYYKSSTNKEEKNQERTLPPKSVLLILTIILLAITTPAIIKRSGNWQNHSGYEDMPQDYIRGMAWAIRFGYDNLGFPNFKDVEEKIKEVRANTILLVETDTARPFNTNWDIVEYLEETLHMYSDYGPATLNETWGCALFSFFPIVRADREVLPSPEGENACLIDATLDVHGNLVDIIGVHFGNTEHVLDRELQADEVATRVMAKSKANRKMIWLGYLTDKPTGPNYAKITKAGLQDVSPQENNRYCIYLFHMGMKPEEFERVDVGQITDTEIQIANFLIPN